MLSKAIAPAAIFLILSQMVGCRSEDLDWNDVRQYIGERFVPPSGSIVRDDTNANKELTDGNYTVGVLGGSEVSRQKESGFLTLNFDALLKMLDKLPVIDLPGGGKGSVTAESMYLAFPLKILGEGILFGGVITTVSDPSNEYLGDLKLASLPPTRTRLTLTADAKGNFSVVLNGCLEKCSEAAPQESYLQLPIVGFSPTKETVILDLAKFGEAFNIIDMIDGQSSGLKTIATKTRAIDFSDATLIWDVDHTMIPSNSDPTDASAPKTTVGARFYLKLEAGLNKHFAKRHPTAGVGFFGTELATEELVTRFDADSASGEPAVHYYMKHVPEAEKANFARAFDDWNVTFEKILGRPLLSYQFVDVNTSESEILSTGDVRYNVLEWDLVNLASYGGLGHSIASQTTGEIFSGNVLIQGPDILKIYQEWFAVADEVKRLREEGKTEEADAAFAKSVRPLLAKAAARAKSKPAKLQLGKVQFKTQHDKLKDPAVARQDFFSIPEGVTYESYMQGYWLNLVGHEIGHNLGLRHNFRGNIFANEDASGVSSSIMEYTNRNFRHKNPVGVYDMMALSYGYNGIQPARLEMFCTDEDHFSPWQPTGSPECSSDDATADPFGYYAAVTDRALNFLVAPDSRAAPSWLYIDLDAILHYNLSGMLGYALSAPHTATTWASWANTDRPKDPAAIRTYVIEFVKAKLCNPVLRNAAETKDSAAAKEAVKSNLANLDGLVSYLSVSFGLGSELNCQTQ